MSTTITLNSYKLFCITEGVEVFTYGYQEAPPTVCPHDMTHSIDTNTIEVVNTYTIPGMFILVDKTQTGGNFLTYGKTAVFSSTTPGTVQEYTISSLPFPVRVMSLIVNPGDENFLDSFNLYASPNTPIGTTTAAITAGSNTILVSATAYNALKIGYLVKIVQVPLMEEFSHMLDKAVVGSDYQITVSSNAVNSYSAGAVVMMSVPRVLFFKIKSASPIIFSGKAPGTSLVPANMNAMFRYTNNNGIAKTLNMVFDVFY